jgi:hypothetical protein
VIVPHKLAVSSNHAQIFQTLIASLTGAHLKVSQLTQGFNRLTIAIGGAMAAFAGERMLRGLTSILERAQALPHELTQIRKLGGDADVNAAEMLSRNIIGNLRGIRQEDALKIYRKTYSLVGNRDADAANAAHPPRLHQLSSRIGLDAQQSPPERAKSVEPGRFLPLESFGLSMRCRPTRKPRPPLRAPVECQ